MTVNDKATTTADSSGKPLPVDNELAKNGEASEQRPEEVNAFKWTPGANLSGLELTCDLCPEGTSSSGSSKSPFSSENDLKIHQMQYHINPHYLSPGDRLLAKITNFVVNQKDSEWSPDFCKFSGLYRCHKCFSVWDLRSSLTQHLSLSHCSGFDDCDVAEDSDIAEGEDETPLKQFRRRRKRRKSGHEEDSSEMDKKDNPATDKDTLSEKGSPSEDKDTLNIVIVSKDVSKSFSENNDTKAVTTLDSLKSEINERLNQSLKTAHSDASVSESDVQKLCDAKNVSHSCENLISSALTDTEISVEQNCTDKKCESSTQEKKPTRSAKSTPTKNVESSSKRPDRKCKTATKALMLSCSFADDYDYESETDSSEDESEEKSPDESNNTDKNNTEKSNVGKNDLGKTVGDLNELESSSVELNNVKLNAVLDQNCVHKKVLETGSVVRPETVESQPEKEIKGESNSTRSQLLGEADPPLRSRNSKIGRARSIKTVDSVQEIKDIMPTPDNVETVADTIKETETVTKATEGNKKLVPVKTVKFPAKSKKGSKKKQKGNKKQVDIANNKSSQINLRFKQQKMQVIEVKSKLTETTISSAPIIPPSPSKRVEDVLPDLVPPRNGRQPSRRSTEAEKSAAIIEHVTEGDKHFCCFTCLKYFANFHQFSDHKNSLVCLPGLLKSGAVLKKGEAGVVLKKSEADFVKKTESSSGEVPNNSSILNCNSYDACKSKTDRFKDTCDPDYSRFTSEAISRVPEFTFNNMHGSIRDIDSIEARIFQSKPNIGAIDKVKMNINGPWTTKDVWESGGWEIGSSEYLTWQKYENRWSENRKFLMSMSHLPWTEQIRFKKVFDLSLVSKNGRNSKKTATGSDDNSLGTGEKKFWSKKQQPLISMLDLRQTAKSVKYMTSNEREEAKGRLARQERYELLIHEASRVSGFLNGEWERSHNFVCGACNTKFEELREALEHKWDDHPYCLVAHFTLHTQLNLPPSQMMYPQLGRGMAQNKGVKVVPSKTSTSKTRKSINKNTLTCTKCLNNEFPDKEAFYVHILECGGDVDWDSTNKKGKKKSKKSKNMGSLKPLRRTNSRDGTESDDSRGENNAAALKRKQRFERFNQPLSQRNTGRFTRLQAELIKKENKPKGKKKKVVKKGQAQPANAIKQKQVNPPEPEAPITAEIKPEPTVEKPKSVKKGKAPTKVPEQAAVVGNRPRRSVRNYMATSQIEEENDNSLATTKNENNMPSPQKEADLPTPQKENRLATTKKENNFSTSQNENKLATPQKENNLPSLPIKNNLPTQLIEHNLPSPQNSSSSEMPLIEHNLTTPKNKSSCATPPMEHNLPITQSELSLGMPQSKINLPTPQSDSSLSTSSLNENKLSTPLNKARMPTTKHETNLASPLNETNLEPTKHETNLASPLNKTDLASPLNKTNLATPQKKRNLKASQNKTYSTALQKESNLTTLQKASNLTTPPNELEDKMKTTERNLFNQKQEELSPKQADFEPELKNEDTDVAEIVLVASSIDNVAKARDMAIVKELMNEMLDRVEKAVVVISKAEELNLSVDIAKNQLTAVASPFSCSRKRKRKSDAPTRIIQVANQIDEEEDHVITTAALGYEEAPTKIVSDILPAEELVVTEVKKPKYDESLSSSAVPFRNPEPIPSPKSILLKALTPSSSGTTQHKLPFRIPAPVSKELKQTQTEREPEVPTASTSHSSSASKSSEQEASPEVILDSSERTRIEFVKDYLSRVALAQAIAKQMLARESATSKVSEPPAVSAPTMESILEARWSLLNAAQQQLQQQQLQQQQLQKQQKKVLQQPPLIQASRSQQLQAVDQAVKPVATIQDLTLNIISANLAAKPATALPIVLPSKPILNPIEVRKNELLASMAFMQPLPAKLPEISGASFASQFSKQSSESTNRQNSPISTVSLRMFRKNAVSKSYEGEEAEDLSLQGSSKEQELKTGSCSAMSRQVCEKQQIKAGTSLLKRSLIASPDLSSRPLENGSSVPEKEIKPEEIIEQPSSGRGRANRSKRSFQEQQNESLDLNKSLLNPAQEVIESDSEMIHKQLPCKAESIQECFESKAASESTKKKVGRSRKSSPQHSIFEAELLATNRSSRSRKGSPQPSVTDTESVILPKRSSRPVKPSPGTSILESELLATNMSSKVSSKPYVPETETHQRDKSTRQHEQAPTVLLSGLEQPSVETKSVEIGQVTSFISESPKKKICRSPKTSPQASIFEAELLATNRSSRSRRESPRPSVTETEPVIVSSHSSKSRTSSPQPSITETESLASDLSSRPLKSPACPSTCVDTPRRLSRSRKLSPETMLEAISHVKDVDKNKATKKKIGRPPKPPKEVTTGIKVATLSPVKTAESSELINEKVIDETTAEDVPDIETSIDTEDVSLSVQRRSTKKGRKKIEAVKLPDSRNLEDTTPAKKCRSKKLEHLSEIETKEEINTAVQEPEQQQTNTLDRSKKCLEEIKIENASNEPEITPRKKLGCPKKQTLVVESTPKMSEKENESVAAAIFNQNVDIKSEFLPGIVPATSKATTTPTIFESTTIKTVTTSSTTSTSVYDFETEDDPVESPKKKLGRPTKPQPISSGKISKPVEPESPPEASSKIEIEQSDTDENVPLKCRKRKRSSLTATKSKVEIHADAVIEISNGIYEDNFQQDIPAKKSSNKGRSKKSTSTSELSVVKTSFSTDDFQRYDIAKRGKDNHVSVKNDVFDFKTDEEEEDDGWLSQGNTFRLKLNRPRQRSSSYTIASKSLTPNRERFFSDPDPKTEQNSRSLCHENMSQNDYDDLSLGNNNDDEKETSGSEQDQSSNRGMKRRRSSFANSFYSQMPRRKVLRRTAARLSMKRASESDALMTAIFDDTSLSGDKEKHLDNATTTNEQHTEAVQKEDFKVESEDKPVCVADQTVEKLANLVQDTAKSSTNAADQDPETSSLMLDEDSFYDQWNRPKRVRKPVKNPVQLDLDSARIVFPLEVRAFAVDRIRQGETKIQVARDLDCPVSTVAGWWNRRDQIAQSLNPGQNPADSADTETAGTEKQLKVNKKVPKDKVVVSKKVEKLSTKNFVGKKANKTSLTRKALVSSMKKKVELLSNEKKFDKILSVSSSSGQPSPRSAITFESTDDDRSCSSADDFFVTKNTDKQVLPKANNSTKREIERIINSDSLVLAETSKCSSIDSKMSNTDKFVDEKELMFTESEDTDEDEEVKTNQEIKNRILKNCFASLAARNT